MIGEYYPLFILMFGGGVFVSCGSILVFFGKELNKIDTHGKDIDELKDTVLYEKDHSTEHNEINRRLAAGEDRFKHLEITVGVIKETATRTDERTLSMLKILDNMVGKLDRLMVTK